jgi:hypothetical protein
MTTGGTPRFDRLALAARFAADERARADAYRRMTSIFLEGVVHTVVHGEEG